MPFAFLAPLFLVALAAITIPTAVTEWLDRVDHLAWIFPARSTGRSGTGRIRKI